MQSHNHVDATSTQTVTITRGHLFSPLNRLFNFGLKRSRHTLVPHLLHSNFPPSDSERAAVCDVLAVVQEEIVQLQRKTTFSHQRRQRLSLCTEILRVHNAVLSPVRWLPPEILEQIFRHCTWQFTPGQNGHWRELPWAISQVCQTWRAVALNLPFLWNRLPIHLRDNTRANLDALATFLEGLLARSRNAPLYLYVYAPFKEYDWHPLINVLVPHSERMEELAIESSTITVNAFQKIKGRLPLLRKLTLSKVSQPRHANAMIIDIFQHAPLLREVTLIRIYLYELMIPWPQLVSFNGNRINRTGLRQVVANSPDLKRLEVTGYCYGAGPKLATLHNLTNLKVKLENPVISSNFFFGSLNLPVVEEIEVEEYQGNLIPHLTTMLSRYPTRPSVLRKLVLRTVIHEPGNLTSLLRLTLQLVELDLELPPLHDLLQLIINRESPPLVPMLETLIIHANIGISLLYPSVTTLAHSRCDIDKGLVGGSFLPGKRKQLRTFRIIFPNPTSCHKAQAKLNGWLEDPRPSSDQTQHLSLWRHLLHVELPELDYKPPPLKRTFDLKFSHRLDHLLGAIEDFQLHDVGALYASQLHSSLRRISDIRPNQIPGDNIYHFRTRSHKILDNWAPSLRKDLVFLQWVMKGTISLIYIPVNEALRESPEALNMVYGLDENFRLEDTCATAHV
ncbi:hypothetical protein BYT27DRAFT_7249259 [Phlegmacium glaucopus]|nr:hypothetical protein BYT27DRAFT_7249259 [Phlegmacium glaucopus]